ncbi:MAG: ribonuclease J [Thermodesulfobacteriota bacterium]
MNSEEDTILRVLPLGGLGEIGLNMMALAVGKQALIIDTGIMFPDVSMPGVDLVIPDLEPLLRLEWNVLGILLTHGHEDHIGALPYVWKKIPVPVYASRLTMGLVEHKLEEFGLLGAVERHVMSSDAPFELGPFAIDPITMCHSIPDAVGLAVTTPGGVVIHTGDFKLDPAPIDARPCDLEKISTYARRGVLALFSDSTNIEQRDGTRPESTIRPVLDKIFLEARGRVFIATFSSNIHRIQQVLNAARDFGRKVVLVGRSMASNVETASNLGYLEVPPGVLADIKELEDLPDHGVAVLTTGSQGEPMSALALMAAERHKNLKVREGDLIVFSSRFIPGNEKAINYMINEFYRRGAEVLYEKISDVHVSGHAAEAELRFLLKLVRPRYFIPIHGEYRHLIRHAHLAGETGVDADHIVVAQNGDLIEITEEAASVVDRLEAGRVFVDGRGVGDVGNEVLRERRGLSESGLVVVVIAVDTATRKMVAGPTLSSWGVTFQEVEPELMETTRVALAERVGELDPRTPEDWERAKEEIRLGVRRNINRILGRKPLVHTVILDV